MEICGSIITNTDYKQFYLTCLYCSTQTDLKDWAQFASHIKNDHSLNDETDKENVKLEKVLKQNDEYYSDTESIHEEHIAWVHDDVEFDENYEYLEEAEYDAHSENAIAASDYCTSTDQNELLDNAAQFTTLDNDVQFDIQQEPNLIDQAEVITEHLTHSSSDYDDDFRRELECSSSDSDDSDDPTEKRSRNKPLTLKRKLKVSFLRHNPRVLHFIEAFKDHPYLWNRDHPLFQDETAKSEAYNTISKVMDKKANVLFTKGELRKSIDQLLNQYAIAAQNAEEKKLSGIAARYFRRCQFLSTSNCSAELDDEEGKTDVIQLDFKSINDMTTSFIEAYGNFPVLYDSSLPEFKCVTTRSEAYIKISEQLAPSMRVNETEVHMGIVRLRKWAYMCLRRVKSKVLQRPCNKAELHYLQLCSFLPPKAESFVVSCEYCDKRFFIDYSLRAHMVKAHNIGELPYLCSQCPRRFMNATDMERHKLRQHCEKMLKCDYCDSTFSLQADLKVHIRCHTGEKPYICELCGKGFRLKLLLDYHINGTHLDLRPYACDLCPKKFRKRILLKTHMKSHLNIRDKKCDDCGATFTCPAGFSRHRKTHQNPS
ncbi:zinc finger protein 486 [Drosophila nasuta]|uniref:zinc finger protein 486 n=1 Tax=Drosophila nasuta TaxID=42062 RepID=UPI00295E3D1A|nr:zinc finger protein 486 [Drosophila nasuta]